MLTTVEKVKQELVQGQQEQASESLLEQLIQQVEDVAETYCRRHFLYGEYTDTFDGDEEKTLYLPGYPVHNLTSLKVGPTKSEMLELAEDVDYVIDLKTGRIQLMYGNFPKGFQNIEVVYECGYDAEFSDDVPKAPMGLEGAVIAEVISRYSIGQDEAVGTAIVNLRSDFMSKEAKRYFDSQQMVM